MLFAKDFLIPANTSEDAPLTADLTLTLGTLAKHLIVFPWGCAGLVGVQLIYQNFQLCPITHNQWLYGNDQTYQIEENLPLNVEPYALSLRGYNLDDTYAHTILIMIEVIRPQLTDNLRSFLSALQGV